MLFVVSDIIVPTLVMKSAGKDADGPVGPTAVGWTCDDTAVIKSFRSCWVVSPRRDFSTGTPPSQLDKVIVCVVVMDKSPVDVVIRLT